MIIFPTEEILADFKKAHFNHLCYGCAVKVFYNLHKRQKSEDGYYVNSAGKTIPLTKCEISY